jgi:hypothetical protein
MATFLDAAGIEHENGLFDAENEVIVSDETVAAAAERILTQSRVHGLTYLCLLALGGAGCRPPFVIGFCTREKTLSSRSRMLKQLRLVSGESRP